MHETIRKVNTHSSAPRPPGLGSSNLRDVLSDVLLQELVAHTALVFSGANPLDLRATFRGANVSAFTIKARLVACRDVRRMVGATFCTHCAR